MLTEMIEEVETKVKPALLFVDDERRVLTSMRAMFRREFEVLLANSGSEALDILEQRDVHVVISDQRMPEMTGVEFLARVRNEYPGSMRILLTGYADLEAVEASINESEVFRYLMKPCPTDELKDAVQLAVKAAQVRDMASMLELEEMLDEDVESIEITEVPVVGPAAEADATAPLAPDAIAPVPYNAPVGVPGSLLQAVNEAQQVVEVPNPDILVLSSDGELMRGVRAAMGTECKVRQAESVEFALLQLAEHPIGVLITDLAVDEREIDQLTRTLKQEVPQLVTIIASERSDAALLIGLINHGQIFRFLLKPLQVAQTRIWLRSAVTKYKELCSDGNAVLRHQVVRSAEVEAANSGLFANVRASISRLKERFAATLITGLTGHRGD